MKKKTSAILAVLASVFCFSACDQVQNMLEQLGVNSNTASSLEETASDSLTESTSDGSTEDSNSSTEDSNSSTEDSNSSTEDSNSSTEAPNSSTEAPNSSMEDEEDEKKYTYNAFTPSEKQLCETYLGEALPFVANNEYYIETFEGEDGYTWVNFYTYGNTQADFNAYLAQFSGYTFIETSYDEGGDAWYCYEKGDIYVEVAYYVYDGDCVIDVYAINEGEETGGDD
ncbi:MAG: hypothetical protein E7371_04935, partial [Clostridiales bacterium]|nr:hypothetical protein [Clostridiales bacterium]